MSRFYRSIRRVLRYAVGIYFHDIQASGTEHIPEEGPLIFAANHPASIMDTVLLGTQTERQIQYMARSGLFRNPAVKLLFNNVGVIPIFRAEDSDGEQVKKNSSSFRRAYETLEDGGCIGIFPEGKNSPSRKIGKLKTGTARIALETEERNDFSLGVKIQPVGLNFDDRERFLSSVLIRFGEPIDVREYAEAYCNNQYDCVRQLTDRIEGDLRDLITHIEDDRHHQLVLDLHHLYGHEMRNELIGQFRDTGEMRSLRHRLLDRARSTDEPRRNLKKHFDIEQFIADTVEHAQQHSPGDLERLRLDIRRYRDHLRQVRLRMEMLQQGFEPSGRHIEAIKMTSYAVLTGPIAAWGFINNAIPYLLTRLTVSKQTDEAKVAFAAFASGLVAFPLFYSVQSWALWTWTDQSLVMMLVYLFSLPIAGFFFLRWWRQILHYRDRILSRTLFRTKQSLLDHLERERRRIAASFERMKQDYLDDQTVSIKDYRDNPETTSTIEAESAS